MNVNIWKHRGGSSTSENFSSKNTYKTKEDALKNCLIFGKNIIDGKCNSLSIKNIE
jgi:hypothetical protein